MPDLPGFVGESEKRQSQKRRYQEEAKEAEEALREMGADTSEGEGGKRVKEYVGEGVVDCLVQRIEGCGLSTILTTSFANTLVSA